MATLTVGEYVFGWNLHIDEAVVRDLGTNPKIAAPGRMSVVTGVCFVLLGLALLLLNSAWRDICPGQFLALSGMMAGLIGLLGYLFGITALYKYFPYSSMALHTSALFVVLGIAVLLARPERGLMAVVTSDKMGGFLARRTLPWAVVTCVLMGWLQIKGERVGHFDSPVGTAFFAATIIAVLAVTIWFAARSLNQIHTKLDEGNLASARFAAIIDSSVDAIVGKDLDSIVTSWNKGAEDLFGYSAAEMIGQSIKRIIPPDRQQEEEEIISRIKKGERVVPFETMRRRKDGQLIDVSVSISPIMDARGKIVGASKVARDITKRVAAEKAARYLEEQLKTVIRNLNEGLVILDIESQLLRWNPAAMRMHGFAEQDDWNCRLPEVAGLFELSTLEGKQLALEEWPMSRAIRGEEPREMVLRVWRKDMSWERTFSYSGTTARDGNGRPVAFLTVQDITQRTQVERELKASFEEIRYLKRALDEHAIVAITDPRGKITYVNDKFCAISKYSREELMGQDHRIINSGHHPKEFFRNLWQTIGSGQTWHGEIKNKAKDGGYYWVDTTIAPFVNEAGKPQHYVAIRADITHRKEAEEQLAISLREVSNFKTALDEHAIVAITDPRGKITYVNDKFRAISKYSREELMGQDHRIINSGYHPKEFFRNLWQTIGSGQTWRGEVKNKAKDGSYYWVDTTIVPFVNDQGKPEQYIAIRADITGLKNAEEALRIKAEDLTRSNRDLEQFAYVASHDLQEPLRAVAGTLQLLERRYKKQLDARADEYIQHAVNGAAQMRTLIEGLLAFSRVGTRGSGFKLVKLDEVVDAALANLELAIKESGAVITRDPLPTVEGDPVQLISLFQNLIGNAMKFHSDRPLQIHIGSEQRDQQWIVSVKDNGIGIEPRHFERIFVIFQRLHTRREYPGTGIGLAICRKIAERHGGHITVESVPGQGSVFHCSFPGK